MMLRAKSCCVCHDDVLFDVSLCLEDRRKIPSEELFMLRFERTPILFFLRLLHFRVIKNSAKIPQKITNSATKNK